MNGQSSELQQRYRPRDFAQATHYANGPRVTTRARKAAFGRGSGVHGRMSATRVVEAYYPPKARTCSPSLRGPCWVTCAPIDGGPPAALESTDTSVAREVEYSWFYVTAGVSGVASPRGRNTRMLPLCITCSYHSFPTTSRYPSKAPASTRRWPSEYQAEVLSHVRQM